MNHEDERPIGVFDSGVGGLTVLKQLAEQMPNESYIYIGDTENLPYGTKSETLVRELATDVARVLLKKNVKALVVACNTISAVALPDIQSLSDVPVIGVIDPTVRYALDVAKDPSLAVIATETTIFSGVYEQKIREIGGGKFTVISKATPAFVPLIEENPYDNPLLELAIRQYLQEFKDDRTIGTLILGCTHYPMIKGQIEAYLGKRVQVVDSAYPTALAVKELLTKEGLLTGTSYPIRVCFTSDDPRRAMRIAYKFLGAPLELRRISIERSKKY